jgi:hypothetical protein
MLIVKKVHNILSKKFTAQVKPQNTKTKQSLIEHGFKGI